LVLLNQFMFGSAIGDLAGKSEEEVYVIIQNGIAHIQKDVLHCEYISMNVLSHSHITNYGGGYYSYLFARMYAAQIWERRLSKDPLNREQGRVLRDDFLRYGSARSPREMLGFIAMGELDPMHLLKDIK